MAKYLVPIGFLSSVAIHNQGVYLPGQEFERPHNEDPLHDDLVPLDEYAVAAFKRVGKDKSIPTAPPPPPPDLICGTCAQVSPPATKYCSGCGCALIPGAPVTPTPNVQLPDDPPKGTVSDPDAGGKRKTSTRAADAKL